MLVLEFFRFIMGYVCFTASGGFPERFINLCRNRGINLWELRSKNGIILACTDCEGYKKIRPVAEKSGMRVRIKKKCGLPFFLERHSRRIGVVIGIAMCIAVLCILSTRIWSIDVTGNVRVPSEEITEVFAMLGVKKGVSGKKINIKSVEINALQKLPEISWLNINIDGCAARIEVRETEGSPENDSESDPTDIIASRDGQIVILRPFNGTQAEKIGNPVLKGDLLISGVVENKDLTVRFCKADGYVVARTQRSIGASQNIRFRARKITEQKKSYILEFLAFSIPIGKAAPQAYREKSSLFINGVTLPVGLTECTQTVLKETDITLSREQLQLTATLRFFDNCTEEFRFLKVESSQISSADTENKYSLGGSFTCLENIGEIRKMQIEQENYGLSE